MVLSLSEGVIGLTHFFVWLSDDKTGKSYSYYLNSFIFNILHILQNAFREYNNLFIGRSSLVFLLFFQLYILSYHKNRNRTAYQREAMVSRDFPKREESGRLKTSLFPRNMIE